MNSGEHNFYYSIKYEIKEEVSRLHKSWNSAKENTHFWDYKVAGARNKNEYIRSVAQRKFAHHKCTHIKQKFKYYRTLLETWERMNPTQCLHKGSLHHTQYAND